MLKENRMLFFKCLIAFALQFLSFIYKPFIIIECLYLAVLIIVDKPLNKICYLFFMLPFYNVFRYSSQSFGFEDIFSGLKSLYLSTLLVLIFCIVMGIKYILDIKNKTKIISLKTIILFATLYILFLLPIKNIDSQAISSLLVMSSLFLAVYLICQYKELFDLKTILDIWLLGIILSVVTYLFKGLLPYLNDYIMVFEQRFFALQRDPNYFGFEIMTLLMGYTMLFLKKQIKYEALIPFAVLSLLGIFTLSKSFLIAYSLYLLVLGIYLLKYLLNKTDNKKKKMCIISLSILSVFVLCGIAVIVLPKLFSGRANVVDTKASGVFEFVNALTTGRFGIWLDYAKIYFTSFWTIIFGYGALNGYPLDAIHNTPLQLVFFGGIIAFSIMIYLIIKFIKSHKCPAIFYILLGILLIHCCSVDLLFSYRTYLILTIIVLCHNIQKCEK